MSLDQRNIDMYGKKLLQICHTHNLSILNGCTPGDSQGHFTYERGTIRSVTDYGIVSSSLRLSVRNFQIGLQTSIPSDHSLILTELNLHHKRKPQQQVYSTPCPLLIFDWTEEAMDRLKTRLNEPKFQLQLQLLEARLNLPDPDIDAMINSFTTTLLKTTKQVVRFRKKAPHQKSKNLATNGMTRPSAHSRKISPN